ncbi:EAL domain-containing protein [Vibrio hannami]|uniref:sensor domain-containing protein n=1 Tax=Vibrio hannami TaxID=2717094 RepID=UPI00240EFD08|nr:bifunctional diguanylate cyclase/phosphodiesterase [Vibrio hannami]MDG3085821.1 EAL domain-containing protein [Vibrio hannami]
MFGDKISLAVMSEWYNNFSIMAALSGYKFLLARIDGEKISDVVTHSDDVFDQEKVVKEVANCRLDVLFDKKELVLSSSEFSFISTSLVFWPDNSVYGLLISYSDNKPESEQVRVLSANLSSHIEKNLTEVFNTEVKSRQSELTASPKLFPEPSFQEFIDCFDDHIWIKDPEGVYTHFNSSCQTAWKQEREELIGKTDFDLFEKEIAEKFLNADQRVITAGHQLVVEECSNAVDVDGNSWHETIKAPLTDRNGKVMGTIGMTRNVTNRKLIEEQLMIAGTVFENSVEGVIITDRLGNIVYVNQAFCEVTGYSQAEAIGRNPRFLKSGRHDKAFYEEMWGALVEEGRWKGELWNRRKDGAVYPELSTISVVYDEKGDACNYVSVFVDISQQKQSEAELIHMAYHDPLTDLPNRLKLSNQIEHEIHHVKRHGGRLATIFIDVDHFKHINDTYGHLIGDEVLCEVADRLEECVREEDTVARIGGDEFVVLISGVSNVDNVMVVVNKLMALFGTQIELSNNKKHRLTGSVGISLYPEDGEDSDTLLRNADAAMYRAKQNGRNNYAFYTQSLTQESESHLRLQEAMHDALENDDFRLVYQPQYNIQSGRLTGLEALLRWEHPTLGPVPPADFIPVAEKTGLIEHIGEWVLSTACRQASIWREKGFEFGRVAVNVSGRQLHKGDFSELVEKTLIANNLSPQYLELEVTESAMMDNSGGAIAQLEVLRNIDVEIAIDDFGTGYSSLSYLQQLPLTKIKIDRSFIADIEDKQSSAIANAIIALGRASSLKVIAEGVETREQLDVLASSECGCAQGYFLGAPMPAEELELILANQKVTCAYQD